MAIVTTNNVHYTAIADALRKREGAACKYLPADMGEAVDRVCNTERLVGYKDGEIAAESRCTKKHYVTTVTGNGKTSISFQVPFEPDALTVVRFDTRNRYINHTVVLFMADFRALGLLCALSGASRSTGIVYNMSMTTTSVYTRYSRAEDGTVTLQNISAASGYATFAQGLEYAVIAVKYTDKTDKELLTDLVNGLSGSGTVEVCQAKVEAAFTEEAWEALIATKPDWTFTFV